MSREYWMRQVASTILRLPCLSDVPRVWCLSSWMIKHKMVTPNLVFRQEHLLYSKGVPRVLGATNRPLLRDVPRTQWYVPRVLAKCPVNVPRALGLFKPDIPDISLRRCPDVRSKAMCHVLLERGFKTVPPASLGAGRRGAMPVSVSGVLLRTVR